MYGRLSDICDIPDELKLYFNDYHINVFEIAYLTDEQVGGDNKTMDTYMNKVIGDAENRGKVLAYHDMGLSISEIAERCHLTEDEVKEILQ